MKKLRLQLIETKDQLFQQHNEKGENEGQTKKRKPQKQRREQIVVGNQLIKLPSYFSQNQNSQLAKEESISLPNSQQQSYSSQQLLQIEEEDAPQQIFVPDYRELLKNQNRLQIVQEQQENQYQTEVKKTIEWDNVKNLYQDMLEQLHISVENEATSSEEAETRYNTRKKVKVQMDNKIKKQNIQNYKSQFYELEDEESILLNKLENYLIAEYKQHQQDQLSTEDEMIQQIFAVLDDSNLQNQLLASILNPEEKYLNQSCESNRSNASIKSVLKSKNQSEDSIKSMRRIQFIEEQMLEEIQEETSNHYNTSMSLFQEKSSYDKAIQFYHTLCDAATLTNVKISQQNIEQFGPISVSFK